jgi:hypothetical protein
VARIALDADLLIAFLDPADAQHARAVPLLQKHLAAGDELLISASVYAEILVRPLQQRTDEIVDQFIVAAGISIIRRPRSRSSSGPAACRAWLPATPRCDVPGSRLTGGRSSTDVRRAPHQGPRAEPLRKELSFQSPEPSADGTERQALSVTAPENPRCADDLVRGSGLSI